MTAPASLSGPKLLAFRLLALGGMVACCLGLAEFALRALPRAAAPEVLEPGLIRPDARLGWALQPGWSGRHTHADFSAKYEINAAGFRATPAAGDGPLTAVVGDSFTFGFGVDQDQTFTQRLNQIVPGRRWENFGVPGYSTDQELLLIEDRILPARPARIVLVVYLGNDLLDNVRTVPLQVRAPKPRFKRGPTTLELQPPPAVPPATQDSLSSVLLGPDPAQWPWAERWAQRSQVFKLVHEVLLPPTQVDLAPVLEEPLQLGAAILERLQASCRRAGAELILVTLTGRSHVLAPKSVSGQFQEYLRQSLLHFAAARQVTILDVAGLLREGHGHERSRLYFPRDGHLTPYGHDVVARLIVEKLNRLP